MCKCDNMECDKSCMMNSVPIIVKIPVPIQNIEIIIYLEGGN